jgi:hypothetical protein
MWVETWYSESVLEATAFCRLMLSKFITTPARHPENRLLLLSGISAPKVTVVIIMAPPSGMDAELRPSSTVSYKEYDTPVFTS